jgi:EmrB/QacA subfamily drug resistance transporter
MTANRGDFPATYPPRRKAAMMVLLLASFMNLIDVTIVNVALPSLAINLGADDSQLQWVVAAYTLAFALALLPNGRLGDTFGRKRMFLLGVAAFTAASLLCGLAPSIEWLIAARVLQGFAGAMMTPQTLAIAQVIFPPDERAGVFALFGLASGLAAVLGPVVGGVLISADLFGLSWRPIFLVNIPVGLFAIVMGLRLIPQLPGQRTLGVDVGGIGLATIALFCLVYPLIEGRAVGWPGWVTAMLATGVVVLGGFVRWQFRQAGRNAPEVLPASLLANRSYISMSLVSALFFSAVPAFFFCFALFLQTGFGLSPLLSGLVSVPFSVGVFIASGVSSRIGTAKAQQRMIGGSLLMVVGMVWMQVLATADVVITVWTFALPLTLAGLGLGLTVSPLFQRALGAVEGRDAGAASGGLQAIQQAGSALGVALMGEMFFRVLAADAGGGAAAHAAAFRFALWYAVIAFGSVALAALLLKPPAKPSAASAPR